MLPPCTVCCTCWFQLFFICKTSSNVCIWNGAKELLHERAEMLSFATSPRSMSQGNFCTREVLKRVTESLQQWRGLQPAWAAIPTHSLISASLNLVTEPSPKVPYYSKTSGVSFSVNLDRNKKLILLQTSYTFYKRCTSRTSSVARSTLAISYCLQDTCWIVWHPCLFLFGHLSLCVHR